MKFSEKKDSEKLEALFTLSFIACGVLGWVVIESVRFIFNSLFGWSV